MSCLKVFLAMLGIVSGLMGLMFLVSMAMRMADLKWGLPGAAGVMGVFLILLIAVASWNLCRSTEGDIT